MRAFYDFLAEHWIHLGTMNPIESTFSAVKLRIRANIAYPDGTPAPNLFTQREPTYVVDNLVRLF